MILRSCQLLEVNKVPVWTYKSGHKTSLRMQQLGTSLADGAMFARLRGLVTLFLEDTPLEEDVPLELHLHKVQKVWVSGFALTDKQTALRLLDNNLLFHVGKDINEPGAEWLKVAEEEAGSATDFKKV